ncbi:hypothetical protein R3P38DRAFT_3291127, partial [Favolaschia claudopus]
MHLPNFSPWPVALVRVCFDSLVMLDIMTLVQVLSQLSSLEDLQLHVHSCQSLAAPIIAPSAVLQGLKHLNCRYINDQQFFAWFISISPKPSLVSLSLGKRMFPHNPGALQLIRSASATLQVFGTDAILRQEVAPIATSGSSPLRMTIPLWYQVTRSGDAKADPGQRAARVKHKARGGYPQLNHAPTGTPLSSDAGDGPQAAAPTAPAISPASTVA